jgi:hypothetical protein
MSSGSLVRVVAPTVMAAGASTGLAVVVNLATGGGPWWLWLVVVALTAAGIVASLWEYRRQCAASATPPPEVTASGLRSVAVHGNPAGTIRTGDIGTAPAPAGRRQGRQGVGGPAPGAVTASGERSVAIDGNPGGDISTGDEYGPVSP